MRLRVYLVVREWPGRDYRRTIEAVNTHDGVGWGRMPAAAESFMDFASTTLILVAM
jgi:hypothetical protein